MRWQTTAVVAVVLLALGAFYYVYEIKGGPARAKVEAQKGRLWTVDAGDVTEVSSSAAARWSSSSARPTAGRYSSP